MAKHDLTIGQIISRGIWLLVGLGVAGLVSGLAMPILWLLLRISGVVRLLIDLLGDYTLLMSGGGIILGVLVGAVFIDLIGKAFGNVSKLAVLFGAIGGAAGGYAGSLMFFPLVAIL